MTAPSAPQPPAPVWVRFLETVEPTPVDRARYAADSIWQVPIDRAEQLIDAGLAELCEPPAAALRVPTEPLEPAASPSAVLTPVPAPAEFAAEEE